MHLIQGYLQRMIDADNEGCEHCSKGRWNDILKDTHWYKFLLATRFRHGGALTDDSVQDFFQSCFEKVGKRWCLDDHFCFCDLDTESCSWTPCYGRQPSYDGSAAKSPSSTPSSSRSSSRSTSPTCTERFANSFVSLAANTSPEPEATLDSSSASPPPPTKCDLLLFQPSTVDILPANNNWFSRLRQIFGFYWQKLIYRPFCSLYRWFRDTQADFLTLGPSLGSLLGLRTPTSIFPSFTPRNAEQQSTPQRLLDWPSSSSPTTTPSTQSVVSNDDDNDEATEDQPPTSRSRMAKTREEVKDLWWKVMAKILVAEHRERREKEEVASGSGWERVSMRSRSTSPTCRSFSISEGTTDSSSLRPEDCFSTVSGGTIHLEEDDENIPLQESTMAITSDSTNSSTYEFDEWYADWHANWLFERVLDTSRKFRSPGSESRFSSSEAAASVNGSDDDEEVEMEDNASSASDSDREDIYISTRPVLMTFRGRRRYRRSFVHDDTPRRASPAPTRPTRRNNRDSMSSISSSPACRSPSRRCRSPSPFSRKSRSSARASPSSPVFRHRAPVFGQRTPSPLNIDRFALPPSTFNLSPTFATSISISSSPSLSRPSSRPSSRSSSPPASGLRSPSPYRLSSRPPSPFPSPSPSPLASRPSSPLTSRPPSLSPSPSNSSSPSPSLPTSTPTSCPSSPPPTPFPNTQYLLQKTGLLQCGHGENKTEDYLSNAHLLRFPATVSARLMMTAETLGVDEVGKRKLVQDMVLKQRNPGASTSTASSAGYSTGSSVSKTVSETGVLESVLESGFRIDGRRRSEEVKGFDWGYGMGSKDGEKEDGYGSC